MGEKDKSSRLINEMKWAANEENKMRAKYMKKDDELILRTMLKMFSNEELIDRIVLLCEAMDFLWIKIEELEKDEKDNE